MSNWEITTESADCPVGGGGLFTGALWGQMFVFVTGSLRIISRIQRVGTGHFPGPWTSPTDTWSLRGPGPAGRSVISRGSAPRLEWVQYFRDKLKWETSVPTAMTATQTPLTGEPPALPVWPVSPTQTNTGRSGASGPRGGSYLQRCDVFVVEFVLAVPKHQRRFPHAALPEQHHFERVGSVAGSGRSRGWHGRTLFRKPSEWIKTGVSKLTLLMLNVQVELTSASEFFKKKS